MIWFAGGVISGFLILVYALFVRKVGLKNDKQKQLVEKLMRI